MSGITRIDIQNNVVGRGAYRFEQSRSMWEKANGLYRRAFYMAGMPLEIGDELLRVDLNSFESGYDKFLGVDVMLGFESGQSATMQEKFLFTTFNTVTVEYMQDWRTGERGDWFKMKAQYYFTGYVRNNEFTNWIVLDWPSTIRATAQNKIKWGERQNMRDGARSSFRYCPIQDFPNNTFMAKG